MLEALNIEEKLPRDKWVYSTEEFHTLENKSWRICGGYISVEDVPVVKVSSIEMELIEIYIAFPSLMKEEVENGWKITTYKYSRVFQYFHSLIYDRVKEEDAVDFQTLYAIHKNKEIRDFIRELKAEAEARRLIGDDPITLDCARLRGFDCIERLARYTEYKREHLL